MKQSTHTLLLAQLVVKSNRILGLPDAGWAVPLLEHLQLLRIHPKSVIKSAEAIAVGRIANPSYIQIHKLSCS